MRRALLRCLAAGLVGVAAPVCPGAAADPPPVPPPSALEALAAEPAWLGLGHYRRSWNGAWESEVDGASFFLAADGKGDPGAELEATVRALLAPPDPRLPEDHPLCAFPARSRWLRERLGVPAERLPSVSCPTRDAFLGKLDPASVTLVFSSYYLNNPVSAFGHTFLRIDSTASAAAPGRRELLDFGVDYAAETGDENAVWYAVKGLVGLFPGRFNAMPYFYKVRKYNDAESRDLWEYKLSLTSDETRRFAEHLFELGRTHIDYWYLTENCSYHVLGALDAVRPELDLVSRLSTPVLPANTVRAVMARPGLVNSIAYRPSLRSQFRARVGDLERPDRERVSTLAEDPDAAVPAASPVRAARVLDAAVDLVELRHFRELVEEPDGPAGRRKQRLLERRASLGVLTPELRLEPPELEAPHRGHGSRRVSLGPGHAAAEGGFVEAGGRLAMHDLLDPAPGYPGVSVVEFLPFRVRWYPGPGRIRLEEAYALRVAAFSPWSVFEKPLSWKLAVGATTIRDDGCDGACTAAHLGTGAGASGASLGDRLLAFATLDADLLATSALEGGLAGGPLRVGVGPAAGLRWQATTTGSWLVTGRWSFLPAQRPASTWAALLGTRWGFTDAVAWGLRAEASPGDAAVVGNVYWYF